MTHSPPSGVDDGLPAELTLALDSGVRRVEHGRVMIGGSPLKLMRLTEAGARAVDSFSRGEIVGSSPARRGLARRLLDRGLAHPRPVTAPFTAADVTCIIPIFGEVDDRAPRHGTSGTPAEALARTLRAIAATQPDAPTVIVVDDASDTAISESAEAVARHWHATFLRRDRNGGPGAARNTGLAPVRTPLVAFVDCDVEPEPAWLSTLLVHLADEHVSMVAPRVRATWGATAIAAFEHDRSPLDLGPAEARVAAGSRVSYVPSTTLLVRMAALDAVGAFDETMRVGEDVDLVWRFVEGGHTVRYEPRAVVRHPARTTWSSWARQRFGYGTSAAMLDRRHPGSVPPLAISGWSAAAWALAAAGHPGPGALIAAATTALLPAKLGPLEHPWREAVALAGRGHVLAWRPLASAVTRPWWPLALGAALVSKRARRAVVVAALVPPLVDWIGGDRALDPLRYTAVRLADDVAYGAGVWFGCLRERNIRPLLPDLHSWPGRPLESVWLRHRFSVGWPHRFRLSARRMTSPTAAVPPAEQPVTLG